MKLIYCNKDAQQMARDVDDESAEVYSGDEQEYIRDDIIEILLQSKGYVEIVLDALIKHQRLQQDEDDEPSIDEKRGKKFRIAKFGLEMIKKEYLPDDLLLNSNKLVGLLGDMRHVKDVYKFNLASIAIVFFEIDVSDMNSLDMLQNIFLALPHEFGLLEHEATKQFIEVFIVQLFLLYATDRINSRNYDFLTDFDRAVNLNRNNLLNIVVLRDIDEALARIRDDIQSVVSSNRSKQKTLDKLKEKYPWNHFLIVAQSWIGAQLEMIAGTTMLGGSSFVSSLMRRGKDPISAAEVVSDENESVSPRTRDATRRNTPQKVSGEENAEGDRESDAVSSKKRRFNEPQSDRVKVRFDSQDSQAVQSSPISNKSLNAMSLRPLSSNDNDFDDLEDVDDKQLETADKKRQTLPPAPNTPPGFMIPERKQVIQNEDLDFAEEVPHKQKGKPRRLWSPEMEMALLKAIKKFGINWSLISRNVDAYCTGGQPSEPSRCFEEMKLLQGFSQVDLKDKARNIKHNYIKNNTPIPPYLKDVTVSKKVIAQFHD
ncbi:hypothetical protein V1511DRAFT_526939 [Dipodascopsis uninucleata]